MPQLSLNLLGPVQITLDGVPLAFRYDKVRALLAYIAVEADRPHTREALAGLLWPDIAESDARRNLSQALFHLRQTIGDDAPRRSETDPPFLLIARDTLQFNIASNHGLDARDLSVQLEECDGQIDAYCAQRLTDAVRLYRGDFLKGLSVADSAAFEEWALLTRERLHRRALDMLVRLADYYEQRGEHAEAHAFVVRQLALEPWREEAHRQAMRLLALSGQRSAALMQYETCRRALADELGVEPASETKALYEQIKDGGIPAADKRPSQPSSPRARLHSLPAQLTPFIGRERELAALAHSLNDPECRLVTLVGPGGIGKTRLALQSTAQQQAAFAHGAAFVPLAPLGNRDQIVTAIADALGLVLYLADDRAIQLIHSLHEQTMLLVLDNFEHLLADAPSVALVSDLLRGAPAVKVLVTSREALSLQGEWVFEVEGLGEEAVALFLHSARRARAGFEVGTEEQRAVVRICQLVGEVPLAVELAASWVRVLSCTEIAVEIERALASDRNLSILSTTARDVPERHRSLAAVFDHSWRLLSPEEQRVLRQLAVFRGGFGRDAAEHVAGASLSLLSALVSKSLLRRTATGRYDLHDLVRQYALGHLQEDELEYTQTLNRHSRYYASLLEERGAALKGAERSTVVSELIAELDNLRLGWKWAAAHQHTEQLSQAADTLFWLYESRCNCREGVPLFGQAAQGLQAVEEPGEAPATNTEWVRRLALGQVLSYQGHFCFRQGQHPQARDLLQRSLTLLQTLAEDGAPTARAALSTATAFLGMVTYMMGDYADGRRLLHEGLSMKRALDDRWGVVLCLRELGLSAYHLGEYAEAYRLLSESLALSRQIGNTWAIAFCLNCLSLAAYAQGAYHEARQLLQEGLALSKALEDRYNTAFALNGLGRVSHALGDYVAARQLFGESIALSREIGDLASMAQATSNLGHTLLALGDHPGARRCFQDTLAVAREAQVVPIALDALIGEAAVQAAEGAEQSTLALLLQVLNQPALNREGQDRAERLRAEIEGRLTPEQVEAAYAQTQATPFDALAQNTLPT